VARDLGQRQRVHVERPERGDDRVHGDAGLHRILVVGLGVDLLRVVGHEVLEEPHGGRAVRRMPRHRRARHVDLRAAALERGQDHLDGVAPLPLIGPARAAPHQPDIVGVGDADVADAAHDVARDVAVAARGLARQVGLDAAEPGLGARLAIPRQVRGDQRRVVGMLTGAEADVAFPGGVGQLLVGERRQRQVLRA
jgi:hypothetical protein